MTKEADENKVLMNERGEKIEGFNKKAEQLAEQSGGLLAAAKALKEARNGNGGEEKTEYQQFKDDFKEFGGKIKDKFKGFKRRFTKDPTDAMAKSSHADADDDVDSKEE